MNLEQQAIAELEKLGWRLGYLVGHGDTEAVTAQQDGQTMVVGDIEKSRVLIPPEALWSEPVSYGKYF